MSCCWDDYGTSSGFHATEIRRARKPHRCIECGHDIQPGERYAVTIGVYDGQPWRYKQCEPCYDLFESMADVTCPHYGGLYQEYRDYLEMLGHSSDDAWRMSGEIRRKHRDRNTENTQ